MSAISFNRASIGDVCKLAWPASLAASAMPLLGAADVWALAQSSRPLDIAAVGLGAVIFSLLYWTFGFIRMSVAGLTAQAAGAQDQFQMQIALLRGTVFGGAIGIAMVLLQWPVSMAAFAFLELDTAASSQTLSNAKVYYDIRIWGAPFAMATNAFYGWLTARGRTDYLMIASLSMTFLNIALDYLLVVHADWGAGGVALGTLIAELYGAGIAGFYCWKILRDDKQAVTQLPIAQIFSADGLHRTLLINRDIFIRTVMLSFAFAWFSQRSGVLGDTTLAANQLLLQLFLFTGLALDGTAIAAETLVGQAYGQTNRDKARAFLRQTVINSFVVAIAAAIFFTVIYGLFSHQLIALLSPEGDIRHAAIAMVGWIVASPMVLVIGFQLDGIFIGATRVRDMRNAMAIAVLFFVPGAMWLGNQFGNHGLWAAFSGYFLLRAAALAIRLPVLLRL